MQKTICELFAGVGGFRLGFNRLESGWMTTWFSQWEPGAKTQWAHDCYVQHFGDSPDLNNEFLTGEDISTMDKQAIPDHTLLVGGSLVRTIVWHIRCRLLMVLKVKKACCGGRSGIRSSQKAAVLHL